MAYMAKMQRDSDITIDRATFPILAVLSDDEQQRLQSETMPIEMAADVAVITEGQQPEFLYLVHSGLLMVSKRHHHDIFDVGFITPGEAFGEASILYEAPANAEVRTTEPSLLFRLPAETVRDILRSNQRLMRALEQLAERRMAASAMAINAVFSKLPQAARETVLYNAHFVSLDVGETLFEEGQSDTRFMYLVLGGKAEATVALPDSPDQRIVFANIGAGDEVGEIAIITGRSHAATVTATTPLHLLKINNETIHAWLKRYPDFGYALYACVQRKLQHALESMRGTLGEEEAKARTVSILPPADAFIAGKASR